MIGTYQLENIIENVLFEAHVPRARKVARKIIERISPYLESEPMNQDMKTEARARGVPEWAISFSERAGKALGFDVMNLRDADIQVYKWILEQEERGQKIETFAEWAKKEKAQYIRMYRKDTSNIKIDWSLAFPVSVGRQTELI